MFGTRTFQGFFVLAIAGLYTLPILAREVFKPGFGVGFVFLVLLLVFLVLALVALVLIVSSRQYQPKWVTWGASALFALWFPACSSGTLHNLGDHLYFQRRAGALRELVARIDRYGTIDSMSDGLRFYKDINQIRYRELGDDTTEAIPLQAALDSAGVSAVAFEDIRQRLIDVGIVDFETYQGRRAFVIEGFLDNYSGLLYVPTGPAPKYGEYAPRGKIISLTRVAPNWWLYATT